MLPTKPITGASIVVCMMFVTLSARAIPHGAKAIKVSGGEAHTPGLFEGPVTYCCHTETFFALKTYFVV